MPRILATSQRTLMPTVVDTRIEGEAGNPLASRKLPIDENRRI